jgi:hypothetical protein
MSWPRIRGIDYPPTITPRQSCSHPESTVVPVVPDWYAGTDSTVVGPRITTPKKYLIRSKGISTSTYRPWVLNPSFSTRHSPGAPQTKIDESPELLRKSKIRRMCRRWTPAVPSPSRPLDATPLNLRGVWSMVVQVQEPRVGRALIDRWQRPSLPCVARAAVHVHPPLAMWFGLLSAELDWWAAAPQASSRPRLLVGAALVN